MCTYLNIIYIRGLIKIKTIINKYIKEKSYLLYTILNEKIYGIK